MEEKEQTEVSATTEVPPSIAVSVLGFCFVWVSLPMTIFLWRFPNYFNAEMGIVSLVAIFAVFASWAISGGILFAIVHDAFKALHGERIKVPYFQSSSKTLIVDLPEGLQVSESPATLKRGDHLPEGATKAVGKMTWDVLNVLSVHHIVLGPNLTIVFDVPIDDIGRRMVCSGVADAIWCELGKPVTFVCKGLPSGSGVDTKHT